jgi:hypothetical protein
MIILMAAITGAAAIGAGLSVHQLNTSETTRETLQAISTGIVFLASGLFAGLEFADVAFNYTRFSKLAGPLFLSLFAVAAPLALYCVMSK